MEKYVAGIRIEIRRGDITQQPEIAAVVNAANAQLKMGGGVAGAIHRAAGPTLEEETRHLAPIRPGEAVITRGHDLPNPYIIHCLGPVYGVDKPEDELLGSCYQNALELAERHQIDSIAFPAISTGAFGYPVKEAAKVAFQTIQQAAPQLKFLRTICFVLFSQEDFEVHEEVLDGL